MSNNENFTPPPNPLPKREREEIVVEVLDLRKDKCPLNFVKTRLAIEKIQMDAVIEVWIDKASESVMNIPKSITAEGHEVILESALESDSQTIRLQIRRKK